MYSNVKFLFEDLVQLLIDRCSARRLLFIFYKQVVIKSWIQIVIKAWIRNETKAWIQVVIKAWIQVVIKA